MADFQFFKNSLTKKWVISAPRRANRTNVGKVPVTTCPFCPGNEGEEHEVYRVAGKSTTDTKGIKNIKSNPPQEETTPTLNTSDSRGTLDTLHDDWHIRVVLNKFPFASIHEIIIHSPDHHKNFEELPFSQVELILQTYRERFNINGEKGQVYIFHNRGIAAGESLPHPHTQLVVIPREVRLEIPGLDTSIYKPESKKKKQETRSRFSIFNLPFTNDFPLSIFKSNSKQINGKSNMDYGKLETDHFLIFCPTTSEWPDEVWVAPKIAGQTFGAINDYEISDLAFALSRLLQILDMRHGSEFPFNFYIYPGKNWYLRLIPRFKIPGGFELGTTIMVNTQSPSGTFAFICEHFWRPDVQRIRQEHKADYWRSV